MLIASAALSIGAALLAARAMTVFGPVRVVSPLFFASGVLVLAEMWIAAHYPKPGAVIIFLHIASLGSILISGFWSTIDEAFDPRSAKQGIGRIIGGATLGGLFGGLAAERVGAYGGVLWILPIVAAFHIACALMLPRFTHDERTAPFSLSNLFARDRREPGESGFRVLRRAPYLRGLALIVLLGNVAATLLDYVFKVHATSSYPGEADLVRFFAVFYTVVSILTLAVQTGMTRRLLEGLGVANTVVIRPAVVTVGGLAALPAMGLLGVGIVRAMEMVVQSSLFRSSYELLFTPVVPDEKRRAKTIVDVGADRMGDIVGAVMIRGVILLPLAFADYALLILAVAISLVCIGVARALQRGYIRALEASLLHRADVLDIGTTGTGMRTSTIESFTGIDFSMTGAGIRMDELRDMLAAREKELHPVVPVTSEPLAPVVDPEVASLIELRSGNPRRVHAELNRDRAMSPTIAAQAMTLLAWDEVSGWASRALAKAAPGITGQLIDRMLDSHEDFAVRRRIPRILSTCMTHRAVDGLIAALLDERFEVRYQSARALARIHDRSPGLAVDSTLVYAAVARETLVDRRLWNEQRLIDEPDTEDSAGFVETAIPGRGGRRMEHVFTVLSLVLPRAPLQIAYKGLLTTDVMLRGTGLEYLESVLPREIWNALRPHLDDTRAEAAPSRPQSEVLENLMRSSQSIELNLQEFRKTLENE
jgi:AAA family ATP:ADP antiporter